MQNLLVLSGSNLNNTTVFKDNLILKSRMIKVTSDMINSSSNVNRITISLENSISKIIFADARSDALASVYYKTIYVHAYSGSTIQFWVDKDFPIGNNIHFWILYSY